MILDILNKITLSKKLKLPTFLLLGWMAIMPLTFSSGLSFIIIDNISLIEEFTTIQWLTVYSVLVITMAFALTPTTVVALISGYFLGFYAIVPVVISYSLASIVGHQLSKPLGSNFQKVIKTSYPKIDAFIHRMSDKSSLSFVVFSRISPILPFAIMNLVLPFVGIQFRPFFWGGMLGMLPRTILAITVGKLANDIYTIVENPSSGVSMQIGFGILLLASLLGFIFIYRRNKS